MYRCIFMPIAALVLFALLASCVLAATIQPNGVPTMNDRAVNIAGLHDFDFLIGRWTMHSRRLRERLKGSHEWIEFEATSTARPLMSGLGNEDEFHTDAWPGFVGMSIRFFNPKTKKWSIYWADNRNGGLEIVEGPPVVGSFSGDVGIFESPDTFEDRPILVRYTWSRVTTSSPRWEQAFSEDGGKTWEANWVLDFTRAKN